MVLFTNHEVMDYEQICNNLRNEERDLLSDVLNSIGKSCAVFTSQQIDDPDLTEAEKQAHAQAVLFENPVTFLNRFGRFLNDRQLGLFEAFKTESNSYDIDHYLNQLRDVLNNDTKKKLIRNRRFEALKRLESEGKYFSETEMEKREPLLYHQLVGQYLSEAEKKLRLQDNQLDVGAVIPTFSNFLLQKAEKDALAELRRAQEEDEAEQRASSDDDSEPTKPPKVQRWGADWEDEESEKKQKRVVKKKPVKITDEEKALLLQEFKTHLHSKFLDGLDADFDYSSVDCNPEYDCLHERNQDEEDKYFDDETVENDLCTDTGIEDY